MTATFLAALIPCPTFGLPFRGSTAAPGVPIALRDDRGRTVHFDREPARIVSLAPHATELLFAAGLGARVVAVDRDSDYPPATNALPRVAALPQPSVERLLALHPDLVVAWGPAVRPGFIEQMAAFGVPVFVSQPLTLDDVASTLARFSALAKREGVDRADGQGAARGLGRSDSRGAGANGANGEAAAFAMRLAALRARWSHRQPVRIFVQIWGAPLITVSDRDVIGDAIRSCGGVNIAGGLPTAAPRVNIEWVLAARPSLVVATDSPDSERRWREVGLLAPDGQARFAYLDATALQRPGPRVLDGVERLCEAIDQARRVESPTRR